MTRPWAPTSRENAPAIYRRLSAPTIRELEPGVRYRAFLGDPSTGAEHDLGIAERDADGSWPVPQIEVRRDWLLVLERV